MVHRTQFREEGDGLRIPVWEAKQRLKLASAVRATRYLSRHEFTSHLEPFLRNLVREEVERVILGNNPSSRCFPAQNDFSESRSWQLQFVGNLRSTYFTGSRIETENNQHVGIVIVDPVSKTRITSGPLSSAKVELFVLSGDFGADGKEDWTKKEFDAGIVREREGKRPLATGDLFVTLNNGEGHIDNIIFTDNSSWIRSRKFRLGARIMQSSAQGFQIREARSGAFIVKDHRAYQKSYPPALGDEIWRLEGIAKDGPSHSKLESCGIRTIQDFMQFYSIDSISLRRILGGNISNRKWEKIVGHAKTCKLNEQLFMYKTAQMDAVIFNCVYKVVGAMCDGQLLHFDELSMSQKRVVEDLKWKAYKNRTEFVPFEPEYLRPSSNLEALPRTGELLGLQPLGFGFSHQDQISTQLGINSPTTSNSYDYEVSQLEETNVPQLRGFPPMQIFTATAGPSSIPVDSFSGFPNNEELGLVTSTSLAPQIDHFGLDGIHLTGACNQANGLFLGPNDDVEVGPFASIPDYSVVLSEVGKRKAHWCKIRAVIKWGIIIRKNAAAKRKARPVYDFRL
ncbi:Calmodulin binding protein, C-terminal domain [Dillenia turbinata]|uniref:Calmodulin binding protein, C-terminal domain n=1 Tax=Dillenia turbinata TaxID=194707 RepID=A0AAN8UJH6_9MAGN